MNSNERGGRMGWTFGSLGGIAWIAALGGVLMHKGDTFGGAISLCIFTIGLVYILAALPWRCPNTPFWKIYLGLLVVIYGAGVFILWRFLPYEPNVNATQMLPLLGGVLPLLTPLFIFGKKTWAEMQRKNNESQKAE